MRKSFSVLLMFISVSLSAQWVQTNGPEGHDIYCIAVSSSNIFAGTDSSGVFISSNSGNNWVAVNTGLVNHNVRSIAVLGSNIFAGTYGGGVYLSSNNGSNWAAVNTGITDLNVKLLAVSGPNIFAGTFSSGVYLSTNNGANWTAAGLTNQNIYSLFATGSNIFAGTESGLFLSTNNGSNWNFMNTGLPASTVRTLAVSGSYLFAGTYGDGVFKSTNNGATWTSVNTGITGQYIFSFAVSGSNIFSGTDAGVFLSTNNGTGWLNKNQGFDGIPYISDLLIANNYLFAGTYYQSVWRRSLTDFVGIQNISTEIPENYSLGQNYPNPFNSSSKFKFEIAKSGYVKIVVYDIAGNEIRTLVNQSLNPGMYETFFDGSQLSSGVYLYQLAINNKPLASKKMLLIK
jgi:hypothetical protein